MNVLSVGELFWDIFDEREFFGGAPLNFSVSAQRLGDPVVFLTAVGADQRGRRTVQSMEAFSLTTRFVQVLPDYRTGIANVTTDALGNATFSIPRPTAFDYVRLDAPLLAAIVDTHTDWIYLGTLAQTNSQSEDQLHQLIARMPDVRCFYDINLREGY